MLQRNIEAHSVANRKGPPLEFDYMISLMLSLLLTAAGTEPAASAKPAKPKKVCERVEMSGSNIPKRVCRTVTETTPPKQESPRADADKPSIGATN